MEIATSRLRLRRWKPEDLAPFAALNADPRVMEFFPKTLTPEESDALAGRISEHFDRHGFGLWAVEVLGEAPFIGYTGLSIPQFQAPFMPCVEIGWRLAHPFWGKGLASEAAGAVLECAFGRLGLSEVVSFTTRDNQRSKSVMERIGMRYCPDEDFDHPKLTEGSPLRPHVLYRIKREDVLPD